MKKWILTVALAAVTCLANAQTSTTPLTSKNGTPILPEAGDWSIGFDAAPWLKYAGNLLSSAGTNSISSAWQTPSSIVGKYMKTESMAYRGSLRIGFNSASTTDTQTNKISTSAMNVTLGFGMQWYRGKGRLKGYYGAEARLMLSSNSGTNTYRDAISANNPGSRVTSFSGGSGFGFGVRGFIGAEYFFAPKMSVGAEYGWGPMISSVGAGSSTSEYWDGSAKKTVTTKTGSSSGFILDNDNMGGAIFLSLYF